MRTVLGRKASYSNDDVTRVWRNIGDYVTEQEARDAVGQAAREVTEVLAQGGYRRPVVGWSGGKDSQALRVVVEAAEVDAPHCAGIVRKLEFPAMLAWMEANAPDRLVTLSNDDLDLPWLATRQQYLFPTDSALGFFWTKAGTRRAQHEYQATHQPDLWFFGRRRIDNNWISPKPYGIHTDRKGMTQYSPIRDWSHELTLAVCHYYGVAMPPIYDAPDGWVTGTGPWPGRRPRTEAWGNTWAIDPSVVHAAAEHIEEAHEWLVRTGRVSA